MESCCSSSSCGTSDAATLCPNCGGRGRSVERITLKALLRPDALSRLEPSDYRFCPDPGCDVVYFAGESRFVRVDVLVPVFQKEQPGMRTVCYCLAIGEDDIAQEVAATGKSSAGERITQLVRSERCACELRNPQGSCCLGNVVEVTRAATSRQPAQASTGA